MPEGFVEAEEGRLLTRLHVSRERDRRLVAAKKLTVLKATGRLACEACEFDFEEAYGARGVGFAECHHRLPLSALTRSRKTALGDLAILCSNCHRMIHRSRPWLTVEALTAIVRSNLVSADGS
jgi:5-methylcytosine-specific restriction protein A